jgi:hypothetical protein
MRRLRLAARPMRGLAGRNQLAAPGSESTSAARSASGAASPHGDHRPRRLARRLRPLLGRDRSVGSIALAIGFLRSGVPDRRRTLPVKTEARRVCEPPDTRHREDAVGRAQARHTDPIGSRARCQDPGASSTWRYGAPDRATARVTRRGRRRRPGPRRAPARSRGRGRPPAPAKARMGRAAPACLRGGRASLPALRSTHAPRRGDRGARGDAQDPRMPRSARSSAAALPRAGSIGLARQRLLGRGAFRGVRSEPPKGTLRNAKEASHGPPRAPRTR